ncbi:hypothetical protein OOZ15_05665 [Galbibacter sp. EGI 63066]|uniref:hypothetical protein n=1 Tax=Galbibacter sp. EGI 63066 TaxID=2993559 RepID=UPI00224881AE|nr:hypothetical protein [Galbibacter sp. EGI 63066]MCX2679424.1 hypothetical protein [Galbibacter sp. EGI 63066]
MILIFKYILPKRYVGLTLWPLIILRDDELKDDTILINHEKIHLRQQMELLVLPFFLIYFMEWLIGIFRYWNLNMAYRNISFEREAYQNEWNPDYLNERSSWSSFKYMF